MIGITERFRFKSMAGADVDVRLRTHVLGTGEKVVFARTKVNGRLSISRGDSELNALSKGIGSFQLLHQAHQHVNDQRKAA